MLYTIVTETTADGLAVIVGDAIVTVKVRASFVRLEISNTTEEIEVKDIATKLADCGGAHKPSYYEFGTGLKLTLADIGKDVGGDKF